MNNTNVNFLINLLIIFFVLFAEEFITNQQINKIIFTFSKLQLTLSKAVYNSAI